MIAPELLCLIMFIAVCGMLMTGYPVAFALSGTAIIFAFLGWVLDIFPLAFLSAFPQRIFATMTNETLVAVPLFVFMGVMLERSRIAEDLLDAMGKLFGAQPGGIAISVAVVGALLAASTGIVGATVVTMGLLSLPTMLRRGYSTRLAAGTVAASGTLGQIIPPSIILILLGDQLSVAYQNAQFAMGIFAPDTVSVNDLFAGALFPGLMLVGFYIVYILAVVVVRPQLAPPIPGDEVRAQRERGFVRGLLSVLIAPVLLIVAVLGSILGGFASPTEAAGVGAVGATMLAAYKLDEARGWPILVGAGSLVLLILLAALFDLRMQRHSIPLLDWAAIIAAAVLTIGLAIGIFVSLWRCFQHRTNGGERVLGSVAQSTLVISAMVFVIVIGAAMFSLVFRGFGGDKFIEEFLHALPGGSVGAVLLVMAVMFIMGFFLDFLEIVFIVVPIVAPILLQMEVEPGVLMSPVWLGVMMGINLQTSFLTPPFGFALFYLRGVAPDEVQTTDIYLGVAPFVAIQLLALVVLWFMPSVATWLPVALYGP